MSPIGRGVAMGRPTYDELRRIRDYAVATGCGRRVYREAQELARVLPDLLEDEWYYLADIRRRTGKSRQVVRLALEIIDADYLPKAGWVS